MAQAPPGRSRKANLAASGGSPTQLSAGTAGAVNLDAADLPADAVEVGRITDAWGVKGWFKVLPHSAFPEALFSSRRWYLLPSEKGGKAFSGAVLLCVREAKEHSEMVVAHADGVDDRDAAQALKGARILISRSSFPIPGTDEYYWVDLIGLNVVNRQGVELGQVKELLSTGPQTVLVIEYAENANMHERMIPFVSSYIDHVDLSAKRITVDWQASY